jgi:hypothetical protein
VSITVSESGICVEKPDL